MAIERRRGQLERPSLVGLALAGVGGVVVILAVLAVLKTIFWLVKVGVVLAVIIGIFVLLSRMTGYRRR